ncbi:acyl-CoA thioesterase [Epibacterium sp. Ofav1-8]|uniref:acyl-CoA thioesterase n=1 Tax=Epibacterium sp. Ofav1-8 TaxID=2917735 RepID=UPI001EF714DE|nr:acyl-CoA thioesterase [Epibacterium sp. Ofav1-8]MCG7625735.1 acyl-CoA thioesterase [Epibacterium sp. Ofav1-8]
MYPIVRLLKDAVIASRQPRLAPLDTHVSRHHCWPWDIDIWMELNNGRTLTLYDLGRTMLTLRTGLAGVLKREGWAVAVAGTSIRYRRRIKAFERFEMKSRAIGWDNRFIYVEQGMWKANGDCANHALLRTVVTDKNGIVPPERVIKAWGQDIQTPDLPDWVQAWCAAEDQRPWPPMADAGAGAHHERLASAS